MLYTYYGDDFTGSTDVLETLAEAGIPAVLFLAPPSDEDLNQFPNVQAIGIAGDSRSRSPEWMTANLPEIFRALQSFNAPIIHYKTCSTFDSAPRIGSIGRAIEIGIDTFHPSFVPIVVAAPHLGRYVLFGNLFAAAGDEVYRIDQHPTMSRHPVTPMLEPDLRKHLAQQTALPIALVDIRSITSAAIDDALATDPAAILFDGLDEASLEAVGELLWQHAQHRTLFAIGSSGLTQSLITAWPEPRPSPLKPSNLTPQQPTRTHQILVLSGSCSPVTQSQIEWALANGFHGIHVNPIDLINDSTMALNQTLEALAAGRIPVLYTSLGPLDSTTQPHNKDLGEALGKLLEQILSRSTIRRTVICGGDTSSHAIQQLPITTLTWLAPVAPGAPLCRAHSADPMFQHAEFILKGGQVGPPNFFEMAMHAGLL
jgi:3-oxoisoapionate kinase